MVSQTIRNADRIAVVEKGRIREIGSHEELIAKPGGRYQRLCALQDLSAGKPDEEVEESLDNPEENRKEADPTEREDEREVNEIEGGAEIGKEKELILAKKARMFGKQDLPFFLVGIVGALLTGIMVSEKRSLMLYPLLSYQ